MISRDQIIAEARKWLGTPFRHQGRIRGRGVDCVGLLLCVMRDLGIADWLTEFVTYPRQPMTDRVLEVCRARMIEIPLFEPMQPGDILVFRVPTVACHTAIVTELHGKPGIVHAYSPAGKVVEHCIDEKWRRRVAGCFLAPGVSE